MRFGFFSSSEQSDSIFADALMDELLIGIPSNVSTFSHASFIILIGALFFDPKKRKKSFI
jgi:hypothetical protein